MWGHQMSGTDFDPRKRMTTRHASKLIRGGGYVAEVDVELIYTEDDWAPYLSLDDAYKLDDVREALRQGDLETATRLARIYKLQPVSA